MNTWSSTVEHFGGSPMEIKAADMIKEIKEIKEENDITYAEIMDQMELLDSSLVPSLSTVRRVFRSGSETHASSFNREQILEPIYNAVLVLNKSPRGTSVHDMEIKALKSVLRVQAEEIDRLMEFNSHLEDRVKFLVGQVREKDELIKKLMEKVP